MMMLGPGGYGMGWMMGFVGFGYFLVLVFLAVAILALIKYLRH